MAELADKHAEDLASFHIARGQSLRANRGIFDEHCEEVAAVVMPSHRNTFLGWGWTTPYVKKTDKQWDAHASIAAQRFSAVMESLLTPPGSQWHRLVPSDEHLKNNRMVRTYLDQVNTIIRKRRNRPMANFIGQMQQVYLSLGLYGNGCLLIDSTDDNRSPRYKYMHLGQVYFAENHQGQVDTFYRFFKLTPRQAMEQFPGYTPQSIATQANQPGSTEELHEFMHCVYPREDYDPGSVLPKDMPIASLYFAVNDRKLVQESGYRKFPAAISRYLQAPGEVYGRGPAMLVLPQIKLLNEEKKSVVHQGHRALEPIILAADDGVIGTFSLRANAVNYGAMSPDGKPLVSVLPQGNLAVGEKMMEQDAAVIDDGFLMSIFKMLEDNPQMTATQVMEITREKGFLVGPTIGRQTSELLGPMISREISLAHEQNALPPMPPALMEVEGRMGIEYDSPMARMQRAENASGFMRYLEMAKDYAQVTGDPSALDWINFDQAAPDLMDISGVPMAWTSTSEQVGVKRKNRAQQQQQDAMLKNAAGLGSAVSSVADVAQKAGAKK